MKRLTGRGTLNLTILSLFLPSLGSAVNIPLTVQEALYTGAPTSGITRSQYPVTVGIPLADSDNINSISQLGLSGASVGQFRALGRWPSGNIEWVLVDTLADVPAGGQSTSITLTNGSGNFGGSNLATDNGSNITINTGSAQFIIRKANFNLFDSVVVNGKTLVASGTSDGLVVMGPDPTQAFPANVSCPPQVSGAAPCATKFASNNDSSSTAVIEENGPVRAVIKADGSHVDATGHTYMHFTVRLHFYKGQTHVKATVILRNADNSNTGNDFNSAFKGFTSYEARVAANLGSSRSFTIAAATTIVSGNFTGSEDAYLYQAYSKDMEWGDWNLTNCSPTRLGRCVTSYVARSTSTACIMGSCQYVYSQDGYQVVHGAMVLTGGDHTAYPQGWADLTDSSGGGIEAGVYQLSGYWPKSLQLTGGGTQVRVGIWPDQSLFQAGGGQAYFQPWTEYSIHDIFFDFHDATLASPANDFLAFQHYLVARAPWQQYNHAAVMPIPMVDPAREDAYMHNLGINCCASNDLPPKVFRYFAWQATGAGNQHELRWSFLRNFLERGWTGRYLLAAQFYHMVQEKSFPHSDGFTWRSHPVSQLDPSGYPDQTKLPSANVALGYRNTVDDEHAHWYGMVDYYYMTGDETVHDQMLDGIKDRYLNTQTTYNTGHEWDTRDMGGSLMAMSRLYKFFTATGDSDAAGILTVADQVLATQVFPELQVSGFGSSRQGISRTRGLHFGCCTSDTETNPPISGRVTSSFHSAILGEGLYEIAQARGPSWPNYSLTMDLNYGLAQNAFGENYVTASPPSAQGNGWHYMVFLDSSNNVPSGCCWWFSSQDNQTNWFHFFSIANYTGSLSLQQDFNFYVQRIASVGNFVEFGSHMMEGVLDKIFNPPAYSLVTVPVTASNTGPGAYRLSWTVPNGAQSYRVKTTANKQIVDWIGFDAGTNRFIGDPNATWNWFASTEVVTGAGSTCPPTAAAAGTTQTCTVTGLDATKSWNFALKAWANQLPVDVNPPARPQGLSLQ